MGSYSDFMNYMADYKLVEDLWGLHEREKQRKKLLARSAELKRRAKILTDEYNRLEQIGDSDGLNALDSQIGELNEEILALSAEFDRFNNEG